jgi:hypothetical protein
MTTKTMIYEAEMVSDDSEDEWEDSEPIKNDPQQVSCPTFSFHQLQQLPERTELCNFIVDANGHTLYRDEPYTNKQYPGLCLHSKMAAEKSIYVTQVLYFENSEHVPVRVPDIKSKHVVQLRQDNGMFIECGSISNKTIFFKKKCVDKKTGHDTAFELGVNYTSHTMGIPAQFAFVVVPFRNGVFQLDQAERSQKFFVKSKRQERFLPHSKKQRKQNVEHLKLETDIQAARETYKHLLCAFQSVQHDNSEYAKIMSTVKSVLPLMPNGAVRIGLAHGSRPMNNESLVNL